MGGGRGGHMNNTPKMGGPPGMYTGEFPPGATGPQGGTGGFVGGSGPGGPMGQSQPPAGES